MLELTLALILFLFPLAYSPGPGNLFFAALGGRYGLRASAPATPGYHLATFVVTVAIGFGFAGIARMSTGIFDLMRYLGSAYIVWLALKFFRAGATEDDRVARRATVVDEAVLLLLNPKAYLIIALMFTQFLPVDTHAAAGLVFWITSIFTLNNFVAFTAWTIAGDILMRRFRNEQSARPLNIASGFMLSAVAVWIFLQ
ncbi:LysE family translocator [Meridianimarinicoccus sp. RP-17]|uniref:LysE family translocator n=1 Tax=Meridianimarinicoccus zhengii TaxID=2056810 RepID=UPI000DAB7680|nr:LysE family translocator [Phycocomes zhengii]